MTKVEITVPGIKKALSSYSYLQALAEFFQQHPEISNLTIKVSVHFLQEPDRLSGLLESFFSRYGEQNQVLENESR